MTEFFWYISGCLNGVLVWELARYYLTRHPYRYVCKKPNCNYRCSSTEMSLVDRLASDHEHYHEREL